MKEEFVNYLVSNGIRFILNEDVFEIGGDTYQLSFPDESGLYFDRGFNFVGTSVEANNYVYKFGNAFYYLRVGEENSVTLHRLKYIGEVESEIPTNSFLGVHGPFELLNGSGNYKDWCNKAKFYGIKNLGICERNTLAGILKFQIECQSAGIKPILGETVVVYNDVEDFKYEVKVFAKNNAGWQNILMINKEINVNAKDFIRENVFLSFIEDIIVILDPKTLPCKKVPQKLYKTAYYQLDSVVFDNDSVDKEFLLNTQEYMHSGIRPVCMCDAYYLDQEYWWIRKELNAIAGTSYNFSKNQYFKCTEEWIEELRELFTGNEYFEDVISEAIINLEDIAGKCNFEVESGKRHLPRYTMTDSERCRFKDNFELFTSAITDGLLSLNLNEQEVEQYIERIRTEIDTIQYGDVVDYFLILRDIIRYCESNGMLIGFGRGSAAGSLVAYLLGITKVNPFDYDLLFERFLNKGRIARVVDVEVINIQFNNDLDIDLDPEEMVTIFGHDKKMEIYAKDIRNGDKIISIKSGDITKMLRGVTDAV